MGFEGKELEYAIGEPGCFFVDFRLERFMSKRRNSFVATSVVFMVSMAVSISQLYSAGPAFADDVSGRVTALKNELAKAKPSDKLPILNQILNLNPNDVEALVSRSKKRLSDKDIAGALTDSNKAISLNPTYAEAFQARSTARLRRKAPNDLQGALADSNQAIKLGSKPYYFATRGDVKAALGDKNGALKDYDSYVSLTPNDPYVYSDRAAVRETLGDFRGAVSDYRTIQKLSPEVFDTCTEDLKRCESKLR